MMIGRVFAGTLAFILSFPLIVRGQATTKPAPTQSEAPIPKIDFTNVRLDEAIQFLSDTRPSFQIVLAGGVQNHYPLVTLHLRDVSPEQVLRVMQKQLQLDVEPAGNPPIYVVSVPNVEAKAPPPAFRVTAYCLTPIIDALLSRENHEQEDGKPTTQSAEGAAKKRKAAMNDVVNVVQTAVKIAPDQVPDLATPTMIEVHEPTEMLIIRGTSEQREAAESVLRALEPRPGTVVRGGSAERK